jgi:aryl-alcohol dehydrogenase-like predicted oxidoreductase
MNYQLLGRSGLRVSDLCLGTMTFGEDWGWGAAKDEARKIYDAYREAGGNFIDTANVYTNGSSEKFLGEFVAGHREEVIVATKYTNAAAGFSGKPGTDANAGRKPAKKYGASRRSQLEAAQHRVHRSLLDAHLGSDDAGGRSHARV